ncbi:MAG: DUF3365 domain-containing protein [Pseudomonadota bacterium]
MRFVVETLAIGLLLLAQPLVLAADTSVESAASPGPGMDESALYQQALGLVQQYAGQLKPALLGALADGGPEHAVRICAEKAPEIGATLTTQSGWQISRVSSRPRNAEKAMPGEWEAAVLADFEARQQQGEPVGQLEYAALVGNEYRFMKAQGVEGVCVVCHGKMIAPSLQSVIQQRYPDDQATGYSLGEVRGAFRLVRSIQPGG